VVDVMARRIVNVEGRTGMIDRKTVSSFAARSFEGLLLLLYGPPVPRNASTRQLSFCMLTEVADWDKSNGTRDGTALSVR
jgi:hypothetical protein